MTRLTDVERDERKVSGGDLQAQITDLAELLGWSWIHIRPGLRANGRWYVPVQGPLGSGWPDLVLLRARDRRLIFAELKRELGDPLTEDQAFVLGLLGAFMLEFPEIPEDMPFAPQNSYLGGVFAGLEKALREAPRVEVHVWRPSDLRDPILESTIGQVLR